MKIGVLALHGDVIEHVRATTEAAKKLTQAVHIVEVRTKEDLHSLDALIIPGGESTTLSKLCEREDMLGEIKKIKHIFGTCAGAIMLAKKVRRAIPGQKSLGLMDIEIDRNAYGRQMDSFEKDLQTKLGAIHAIFIRAPKIVRAGPGVTTLAKDSDNILACEQKIKGRYYMAACFNPELTSTKFHEHFLKKIAV